MNNNPEQQLEDLKLNTLVIDKLIDNIKQGNSEGGYTDLIIQLYKTNVFVGLRPDTQLDAERLNRVLSGTVSEEDFEIHAQHLVVAFDDKIALPVFTDQEQIKKDIDDYTMVLVPFVQAVQIALEINAVGIVINAESTNFLFDSDMFDMFDQKYHQEVEQDLN